MGMNSNASAADVYNNPDFYGQPNAAATTGGATATGAPVAAGAARGAMSPWVMPGMMGLGAIANIYGSKQQANAMEDMQANNMAAYQQYGIRYPDAATIQAQTNQGMSGLAEMMLKNNQASTENMAARGLGGPAVGNQINQNYMNYLQSLGKFQNQMAVTANTPVSTSSVPYQNQPYPTVGGGLSNMAGGLTGTIGGIGMYDYLRNSSLFA
jgi:hypothetical protein